MPSHVTTHVLDTAHGGPAVGVPVTLSLVHPSAGVVEPLAIGSTDADGRVADLGPEKLPAGRYRLTFDIETWVSHAASDTLFPTIDVTFVITETEEHYHVPLLLSPYAYSTYRGS